MDVVSKLTNAKLKRKKVAVCHDSEIRQLLGGFTPARGGARCHPAPFETGCLFLSRSH